MSTVRTKQESTGRGLLFPLRRVHNDFENGEGFPLLKSCVRKATNTRAFGFNGRSQGEYRWRRDFGSFVHLLRHSNMHGIEGDLAVVYVARAVDRWEPRATVVTERSLSGRDPQRDRTKRLRVFFQQSAGETETLGAQAVEFLEISL